MSNVMKLKAFESTADQHERLQEWRDNKVDDQDVALSEPKQGNSGPSKNSGYLG